MESQLCTYLCYKISKYGKSWSECYGKVLWKIFPYLNHWILYLQLLGKRTFLKEKVFNTRWTTKEEGVGKHKVNLNLFLEYFNFAEDQKTCSCLIIYLYFVVLICLMGFRFTRDKDSRKVISYKKESETPVEIQPKIRLKNNYCNKIKILLILNK